MCTAIVAGMPDLKVMFSDILSLKYESKMEPEKGRGVPSLFNLVLNSVEVQNNPAL